MYNGKEYEEHYIPLKFSITHARLVHISLHEMARHVYAFCLNIVLAVLCLT